MAQKFRIEIRKKDGLDNRVYLRRHGWSEEDKKTVAINLGSFSVHRWPSVETATEQYGLAEDEAAHYAEQLAERTKKDEANSHRWAISGAADSIERTAKAVNAGAEISLDDIEQIRTQMDVLRKALVNAKKRLARTGAA